MADHQRSQLSGTVDRALLDDDRLVVPVPTGTSRLAATQRLMARWSNGADHVARRRIAVDALSELEPRDLRVAARALTLGALPSATDLVDIARSVPVAVLAEALGFRRSSRAAHHQRVVTAAISPEDGAPLPDRRAVNRSLDWLLRSSGEPTIERSANHVALLHQCLDATAALVTSATLRLVNGDLPATVTDPAGAVVASTLHRSPPVTRTVRVRDTGELVPIALTVQPSEPPLAFGAGAHACPGSAAAVALAEGVIEALLTSRALDRLVVPDPLVFEQRPNLRIPRHLPLQPVGAAARSSDGVAGRLGRS